MSFLEVEKTSKKNFRSRFSNFRDDVSFQLSAIYKAKLVNLDQVNVLNSAQIST